jgi:UDPglucose--hexose-1-phosphate uridylyltransferase
VYPHRQVPDIPALSGEERDAFVPLYLEVLQRLDGLFGVPMPYIAAWYQAPVRVDRDLAYLHLEVFSTRRAPGKLKYLAGSESAMGVFVNDVRPEQAASMLREVQL